MAKAKQPKSKDVIKLGKRIKELRVKAGYKSYEIFAYEHGFSRAQYGRYEKGENLRYDNLIRVMKALEVTPEEFFKGI